MAKSTADGVGAGGSCDVSSSLSPILVGLLMSGICISSISGKSSTGSGSGSKALANSCWDCNSSYF